MGPYRKEFEPSESQWYIYESADENDTEITGSVIAKVQTERLADLLIIGLTDSLDDDMFPACGEWLGNEHGESAVREYDQEHFWSFLGEARARTQVEELANAFFQGWESRHNLEAA